MRLSTLQISFLLVIIPAVMMFAALAPVRADTLACSVTLEKSPISEGESTTLNWNSSGSSLFYINNVGYVGTSGSAQVSPGVTTDYSGDVTGDGDEVIASFTMDIMEKHGGYSQGQCF